MLPERYGVIRGNLNDAEEDMKSFRIWHNTYLDAVEEAERLCRKERASFIIVKAIGKCSIGDIPIRWENTISDCKGFMNLSE